MMKTNFVKNGVWTIFLIALFAVTAAAQGGKAMPLRIEFKKGASSAVVAEKLKNSEEMDLVFAARKGQTVTLKIVSTPTGKYALFRVSGDEFDYASENDANYNLTFVAPETGDYLVFVRNRPTAKVKSAKFALTLSIK